ncbi:MAG: hypothetical protein HQM16_13980 [Deltaproteobacteria bacterium]|nr:hypothetical protein [Deltaproteobacteria bacterium]
MLSFDFFKNTCGVLSVFVILTLLTACTGLTTTAPGTGGSGPGTQSDPAVQSSGGTVPLAPIIGGSINKNENPINEGVGEDAPMASLPLPELKKEKFLTFQSDSEGNVPIMAQAGAVENFEVGDKIAVSAEPITVELACNERIIKSSLRGATWQSPWSTSVIARSEATRQSPWSGWLIKEAHAQTTTACSDEFTYCPINPDGSFECFVNPEASTEKLYYTVVDNNCIHVTDEVVEDVVQKNMLYIGAAPDDIKDVGNKLYSLANGNGVIASDNGSGYKMTGSYSDSYKTFDANGTALAYADTDSLVGVMGDNGVQLLDYNAGTDMVTNPDVQITDPNAKAYTFLRAMNGVLYYGIEQESASKGVLNFAVTGEKWRNWKHKEIIITDGDTDNQGNEIRHTRTLGFGDIKLVGDIFDWKVVVFSDGQGVRLRYIYSDGKRSADRFDGDIWKQESEVSIEDLIAYNGDGDKNIHFAMLDNRSQKVWIGEFNTVSKASTMDDANAVVVGNNPQAMTYSHSSGNLYVLNKDDQTVSVMPLMLDSTTPKSTPIISATIKLSDSVPGKSINFAANNLIKKDKQLVITDETTKALLLIDVGKYEDNLTE